MYCNGLPLAARARHQLSLRSPEKRWVEGGGEGLGRVSMADGEARRGLLGRGKSLGLRLRQHASDKASVS